MQSPESRARGALRAAGIGAQRTRRRGRARFAEPPLVTPVAAVGLPQARLAGEPDPAATGLPPASAGRNITACR
jgi:hypothetical protein